MKKRKNRCLFVFFLFVLFFFHSDIVFAQPNDSFIQLQVGDSGEMSSSIKTFLLVTILTLAPQLFLGLTCFTHFIIVLSMARQALGTASVPPNAVLTSLAVFLTMFVMNPVFSDIYNDAWIPYDSGEIGYKEAFGNAADPLKEFMLKNTGDEHIKVFTEYQGIELEKKEDVSITTLIPAHLLSQMAKGLFFGSMVSILMIAFDMIIASILMTLGLFMLPPVMISGPFKIILFTFLGGFTFLIELMFNAIQL